jgi:DNA processing protein
MLPNEDELYYRLALSFVPDVGIKRGMALLERFGTAKDIFKAPLKELKKIDGITEERARAFRDESIFSRTEEELKFVQKNNIDVLLISDSRYPQRLLQCNDAPLLLFYKGTANLNAAKMVAVVGTRKNTEYGTKLCETLIEGLQMQEDIVVVSGLAHGIDGIAHKKSLEQGIPTIAGLGHGLDRVYPAGHRNLAKDILLNGGLLTEFPSGTMPDRTNFPMRNRIVAGVSDVTVIVESDKAGGSLITAYMASGYNREVAAYPGRVTDTRSAGCNDLIRSNIAAMITGPEDLLELMNWNKGAKQKAVQKQLFLNLSPDEQKIIDILQTKDSLHADDLYYLTGLGGSQLAATLLQLEMQSLIKTLPGKHYRIA